MPKNINQNNYKDILKEKFIYIGIAEDLQMSINVLASRLGFRTVNVPNYNVSQRNETINRTHIETFKKNNLFEYEIYNYIYRNHKNMKTAKKQGKLNYAVIKK